MEGRETAVLHCAACDLEGEHTVQYAGRVLVFVECAACGFTWHHSEPDLRSAYVGDLASRLWSKPRRWVRRLHRHPLGTLVELPVALVSQPVKIAREIVAVLRG